MKNISVILNVVLLLAVIILYVLHFSGKGSGDGQQMISSIDPGKTSVAYVRFDTLLSKYDFFKEKEEEYAAKKKKLETDYRNRVEGLQREVQNYQNTVGSLTISQAKAVEEDLQRKQQNLMMYENQLSQQLMGEEMALQNELYEKVTEYLNDFGLDKNLQLILGVQKGSGILYVHDSLDITSDVITGLNAKFQDEKEGAGSKEEASDSTSTK